MLRLYGLFDCTSTICVRVPRLTLMVMIGLLETGSQDFGMDEHWDNPRTAGKLQAYATNHQQGSFPQDSKAKEERG